MATATAPVKKVMRVPRIKWQREVQPGLEDLGFTFLGVDASSHAIFQHPTAGQVRLASSPSGDPKESQKQALGRARRLLAIQESEAASFLRDLRGTYGVGEAESKKIRLNLMDEIEAWAKRAKPRMKPKQIRDYLRDSPFVENREWQRGSRKQDYVIHGARAFEAQAEITDEGVEIPLAIVDAKRQEWLDRVAEKGGAVAWLATFLADGPMLVDEVKDGSPDIPWAQIEKARDELGVIPDRESKYQGRVYWRLPAPREIAEYEPERNGKDVQLLSHERCNARHPGTDARCTLPAGHEGAHEAYKSPLWFDQQEKQPPPVGRVPRGAKPAVAAVPAPEPESVPEPVAEAPAPVPTPVPVPVPGVDLVTQITQMAARAARAEEAEARVALVLDEIEVIREQVALVANATTALQNRLNQALSILAGEDR